MHNKTYPEGSIAEGYIAEECLTFCSRYFKYVETIFNWLVRNVEESMGVVVSITLDSNSWIQAHHYVLFNCEEITPFASKYYVIAYPFMAFKYNILT